MAEAVHTIAACSFPMPGDKLFFFILNLITSGSAALCHFYKHNKMTYWVNAQVLVVAVTVVLLVHLSRVECHVSTHLCSLNWPSQEMSLSTSFCLAGRGVGHQLLTECVVTWNPKQGCRTLELATSAYVCPSPASQPPVNATLGLVDSLVAYACVVFGSTQ